MLSNRWFWPISIVVLIIPVVMVIQKERIVSGGRTVLLELAPRDPRSILQGDYMVLNYRMNWTATRACSSRACAEQGALVLRKDKQGIGRFLRFAKEGESLKANEFLLRYKTKGKRVLVSTDAFFFQEGFAKTFERARYGQLRVDARGHSVLVALCNAKRKVIQYKPKSRKKPARINRLRRPAKVNRGTLKPSAAPTPRASASQPSLTAPVDGRGTTPNK